MVRGLPNMLDTSEPQRLSASQLLKLEWEEKMEFDE